MSDINKEDWDRILTSLVKRELEKEEEARKAAELQEFARRRMIELREKEKPEPMCSFCGSDDYEHAVRGPNQVICDSCIDLCVDIIEDQKRREKNDT